MEVLRFHKLFLIVTAGIYVFCTAQSACNCLKEVYLTGAIAEITHANVMAPMCNGSLKAA